MAGLTTTSQLDDTVAQVYSAEVEHAFLPMTWWVKFMGYDPTSVTADIGIPTDNLNPAIVVKRELDVQRGQTVNIPKLSALSVSAGGGNLSDSTKLLDNEAQMSDSNVSITPVEVGNAIAFPYRTERKYVYNMREQAKILLTNWAARQVDLDAFAEFETASSNDAIYSGNASSTSNIDAADTLTLTDISKAAAILRGNDVPPVGGWGNGYYVAVIDPYCLYDVTQTSAYQQAQREANLRGNGNPLFDGPRAPAFFWDGVAVYSSTHVSRSQITGTLYYATNIVCGARSLAWAIALGENGQMWSWREEPDRYGDYGRSYGIAVISEYKFEILNEDAIVLIYSASAVPS